MMNRLSHEVEAGWVVVSVAMVVLLSCVSVLCSSMVVLRPAGVVAERVVRLCVVVMLSLLVLGMRPLCASTRQARM